MIRVASLKDMVHTQYNKPDIAGMTPKEQLKATLPAPMTWWPSSTEPTTAP